MTRRIRWVGATWVLVAGACSLTPAMAPPPLVYDFGPAPTGSTPAVAPASVQVSAPPWLDGTGLVYRLEYRDPTQLASYRDSRWAAPPSALLAERLRQRFARSAGRTGVVTLRIEIEEFCHSFSTPERSRAVLRLRATLLDPGAGRVLRQRAFAVETEAASGDAGGGAHALASAVDQVVEQLLAWAAPD
jgi:cholesterol transport system auxiliary component